MSQDDDELQEIVVAGTVLRDPHDRASPVSALTLVNLLADRKF